MNYTVIFSGVDADTKEAYSVEYDCSVRSARAEATQTAARDCTSSAACHPLRLPDPAPQPQGEGLLNNYCIHILGRKPTMSKALVDKLVAQSLAMNLNTQNLPFNMTKQGGCW